MAKVLVADDERDVRKTVAGILSDAGFDPVQATTGARAISIHREKVLPVVLLDMRMPGRYDGLQTAREIRSNDPATRIVAVTAFRHEYEPQDRDHIVDEWVSKPISSAKRRGELVETVRRMYSKSYEQMLGAPINQALSQGPIPVEELIAQLRELSAQLRNSRDSRAEVDSNVHDLRLALIAIASGLAATTSGIGPESFSRAFLSELGSSDELVRELGRIRITRLARAYEADLRLLFEQNEDP